MLIVGGIGLWGLRDVSTGLVEALRSSDYIFLEEYTSITPGFSKTELEKVVGRRINPLKRIDLEGSRLKEILELAKEHRVAILTHGNPFVATTHAYIVSEAYRLGIPVEIYPAPSVIDAILCSTGLHVYKFGRIATLVYPDEKAGFFPYTTYRVLGDNLSRGLHTLLLLDLRVEEGLFMSIPEAASLLLRLEDKFRENIVEPAMLVIGVSRALSPEEEIFIGTLEEATTLEKTSPPHSLVIPGVLHDTEIDFLHYKTGVRKEVLISWSDYVKRRLRST